MTTTSAGQPAGPDTRSKDARTARRAVLYQRWVDRTSRALDILALIFLIDFLLGRVAPGGPTWWQPTLSVVSFVIWFAFAVDYLVRLTLSPSRSIFVTTHKLDLLMVLLPMLRMLRVILLLRKSFKSIPTDRIAGSLFTIVIGVVALGAVLEWQVEHNAPDANITTLGTAFWWAITTTTTVGYGDTYPVTTAGRIIASCVMVVGIGLIGTVSATVAAWFVSHNQKLAQRSKSAATTDNDAGAEATGGPVATEPLDSAAPSVRTADLAPELGATLAALSAQIDALSSQQAHLQATIDRLAERRD
jgi:voltage-gated potassium channel